MNLTEKLNYTGTVIGIQECADTFTPQHKVGVGVMYCHNIEIAVEVFGDEVVSAQICSERPKITEFEANDVIRFQAGKFTKGRYSIKFVEKLVARTLKPPQFSSPHMTEAHPQDVRNPVVGGTAIERASSNAAHFLQMQGNVTDERLIELSKKLYNLYIEHSPQ